MKPLTLITGMLISIFVFVQIAEAKGRTGSHRTYHGHGKGSYYVGGKVK